MSWSPARKAPRTCTGSVKMCEDAPAQCRCEISGGQATRAEDRLSRPPLGCRGVGLQLPRCQCPAQPAKHAGHVLVPAALCRRCVQRRTPDNLQQAPRPRRVDVSHEGSCVLGLWWGGGGRCCGSAASAAASLPAHSCGRSVSRGRCAACGFPLLVTTALLVPPRESCLPGPCH